MNDLLIIRNKNCNKGRILNLILAKKVESWLYKDVFFTQFPIALYAPHISIDISIFLQTTILLLIVHWFNFNRILYVGFYLVDGIWQSYFLDSSDSSVTISSIPFPKRRGLQIFARLTRIFNKCKV